jgi:cytochrome P450
MQAVKPVPYDQLNPSYRHLRETNPVKYDEYTHMWQIYRYQDIQKILLDPTLFSSEQEELVGEFLAKSMVSTDPPHHRKLHSLASQAFTPRRVRQLETHIEILAHSLLDAVADRGYMDVVADLAYPLPAIVIAELMGIPPADRDEFKHWTETIVKEIAQPSTDTRSNAQSEFIDYLYRQLEIKRRSPGDDLICDLIAAEIDGEKLSDADIVITTALVLMSGHETTTNLISNTFLCLYEYPHVIGELQADLTLIPGAIEEVLRYWPPSLSTFRKVKTDTQIHNQIIKAGEFVQVMLSSANRDAAVFPNPDQFDIHRTPNRHIAFGHGIHFCLGAPLARLEGTIALRTILKKFSSIQFPETHFEPLEGLLIQGVRHVPITFTRAK